MARQSSLWNCKKVRCKCARCLDPRELGTDFGTMKCTQCDGSVLPIDTADILQSDWKCDGECQKVYRSEDIKTTIRTLSVEIEAFLVGEAERNVKNLEALLNRIQKFLHPNHAMCVSLKKQMIREYGCGSDTGVALLSDAELVRIEELCRDVRSATKHPCLQNQESAPEECLLDLFAVKMELTKRKKAAGLLTPAQSKKLIEEHKKIFELAINIQREQYDPALRPGHLPPTD